MDVIAVSGYLDPRLLDPRAQIPSVDAQPLGVIGAIVFFIMVGITLWIDFRTREWVSGSPQGGQLAGVQAKQRPRRLGPGWVWALTSAGSLLVAGASSRWQFGLAVLGSFILGFVAAEGARRTIPNSD